MPALPHTQPGRYRWEPRAERTDAARGLHEKFGLHPAVARVMANRGHNDSAADTGQFIEPTLADLLDPFLLRDMDRAVERIADAITRRERITIYGDYDTDGATSTAVLTKLFRFVGHPAQFYIPHRVEEGYGLNTGAIDLLAADGTALIICVDNGIGAVEQVDHAASLGMDVVVTDHHQQGPDLPRAAAVVNPNRHDCTYPTKHLAGVGVAFKLCHALLKRLAYPRESALPFLRSVLDLVAIGTIADVTPVTGENRILVKFGLEQLAQTENPGLAGMMRALRLRDQRMTTRTVGFQIAPRLNAAGRTDHAGVAVQLLTAESEPDAFELAEKLEGFNNERRAMASDTLDQGMQLIGEQVDLENEQVIVVCGREWHVGVIGIVASRMLDEYHRPVIVIADHGDHAKGSARSIGAFNIHEALQHCSGHLTTFGGHPFAAGLQLHPGSVNDFRRAMNEYAASRLDATDLQPLLSIDTAVEPREMDLAVLADLRRMEPFGPANPVPVVSMENMRLADRPRVVGTNHLKLRLKAGGQHYDVIGFGLGRMLQELEQAGADARIEAAFTPVANDFHGSTRLQLELKDLRVAVPA